MNFSGALFCWKKQCQIIRPKNSGPKFRRPKFVSQNSGLNSGSGGAKSPVQTFVPDKFGQFDDKKHRTFVSKTHDNVAKCPKSDFSGPPPIPVCLVTLSASTKPTKLAQPCLSRSTIKAVIRNENVQIWVWLFLYGWSFPRCERANLGVFDKN